MARKPVIVSTIPAVAPVFDMTSVDWMSRQEPVAPRRFLQSQSSPNVDWEGMVRAGENPLGLIRQEPNGTGYDRGNGWNDRPWSNRANGKFSRKVDWARNGGNRTGE